MKSRVKSTRLLILGKSIDELIIYSKITEESGKDQASSLAKLEENMKTEGF